MWAANNFSARSIANRDLALNTVNWLTRDEDLISIRPKEPEDRRLNITGNACRWCSGGAWCCCRWSWWLGPHGLVAQEIAG